MEREVGIKHEFYLLLEVKWLGYKEQFLGIMISTLNLYYSLG